MLRALVIFSLVSLASTDRYSHRLNCPRNGKVFQPGHISRPNRFIACVCTGESFPCRRSSSLSNTAVNETCTNDNKLYDMGDIISADGCNVCTCVQDREIYCTHITCQANNTCDVDGTLYKTGEKFKKDCNVCFCQKENVVICTEKLCKPCPKPKLIGVANDTCYCNNTTYKIGNNFTHDCYVCICEGLNAFMCTRAPCNFTPSAAVSSDGKGCDSGVRMYKEGDRYMATCVRCTCMNGTNSCVDLRRCFDASNAKRMRRRDTCNYHGMLREKNTNFLVDCNTCACQGHGIVNCTQMSCTHLQSPPNGSQAGAYKADCEHRGIQYPRGKTSRLGRAECYCPLNGEKICLPMNDKYKRIMVIEDTCVYGGYYYSINQTFYAHDCLECTCLKKHYLNCKQSPCEGSSPRYPLRLNGSQNM